MPCVYIDNDKGFSLEVIHAVDVPCSTECNNV